MERIGRYEIRSVVGSGSFATVYEAFDPRLESVVALKVLAENWSHQPDIRARFRQEAVLLRRVQTSVLGSDLVEVFDIDETEDGRPYFVMPVASGGSLETRTQGGAIVSPAQVLPVLDILERSLGTLHRAGIVHRDVKPSNLLIVSEGTSAAPRRPGALIGSNERLILGDLGLAKELLDDESALTIAGGTPRFMAPEQRDPAAKLDGRADLFGATAVIAELLTGSPGAPLDGVLPDALTRELRKGLSESPDDRHLSAADWGSSLRAAIEAVGAHTSTPPPGPTAAPAPLPPPASVSTGELPAISDASSSGAPSAGGLSSNALSSNAGASDETVLQAPSATGASGTTHGRRSSDNRSFGRSTGRVAAVGIGLVLAVGAIIAGIMSLGGSAPIGVIGDDSVEMGETIVLQADVPAGIDYTWTVGSQRFTNQDISLTPQSTGRIPIQLEAEIDGVLESVDYDVTVTEP